MSSPKRIVCPLCVQWRCQFCKSTEWPNCCPRGELQDAAPEPYWPDGSVAVLTQDEYCERCSKSLEEYERTKDEY